MYVVKKVSIFFWWEDVSSYISYTNKYYNTNSEMQISYSIKVEKQWRVLRDEKFNLNDEIENYRTESKQSQLYQYFWHKKL